MTKEANRVNKMKEKSGRRRQSQTEKRGKHDLPKAKRDRIANEDRCRQKTDTDG